MSKICTGVISFLATLFIMFKINGLIDWPWLWVLSPLWVPFVVCFIGITAALAVAALKGMGEAYKQC